MLFFLIMLQHKAFFSFLFQVSRTNWLATSSNWTESRITPKNKSVMEEPRSLIPIKKGFICTFVVIVRIGLWEENELRATSTQKTRTLKSPQERDGYTLKDKFTIRTMKQATWNQTILSDVLSEAESWQHDSRVSDISSLVLVLHRKHSESSCWCCPIS